MCVLYKPLGALEVKRGETYTINNIPAECDVVVLLLGVRIKDKSNNLTPIRGVKVLIINDGVTEAKEPLQNIPIIWKEGEPLVFDENFTYEFLDDGRVSYGVRI